MVSRSLHKAGQRERGMGAKQKLNAAHVDGTWFVAGVIGLITGSWPIFVLALIVLVVGSIYAGNIR